MYEIRGFIACCSPPLAPCYLHHRCFTMSIPARQSLRHCCICQFCQMLKAHHCALMKPPSMCMFKEAMPHTDVNGDRQHLLFSGYIQTLSKLLSVIAECQRQSIADCSSNLMHICTRKQCSLPKRGTQATLTSRLSVSSTQTIQTVLATQEVVHSHASEKKAITLSLCTTTIAAFEAVIKFAIQQVKACGPHAGSPRGFICLCAT